MKPSTSKTPMPSEWVMAKYSGAQARSVIAHAEAGVGYYVLERPDSGNGWVTVAFRRPKDSPAPEGVAAVMNPALIRKLERLHTERHGISSRQ